MSEPMLRADLVAGYERPYARWLPVAWRANHVPELGIVAGMLLGASLVGELVLVDGAPAVLVAIAVLVAVLVAVWSVWATVVAIQVIRKRIHDWTPVDGELARVRMRRGHAGEADRVVAHDEFAVAVDDAGDLITWRFRPLPADRLAPEGAVVIPGVPTYAAVEVGRVAFDGGDAARAAEQLAEAQHAAAELEANAAAAAREALERSDRRRELTAETLSTAEALRRHTGQ